METMVQGETRQLELSPLEKSVVGLFGFIVMGMLGWTLNTTNESAVKIAVIETQVEEIRKNASDRYTGQQARTHEREMERRVSRLEAAHGLN